MRRSTVRRILTSDVRIACADRWRIGYEAMVVKATDYNTGKSPRSWAKIIAMRHALSQYPDATFVWFLDQNAYIMDLDRSLEAQVMAPAKLESLMIKDWPVVPPDSIIKTFSHLKGGDAALIISQDDTGLVTNSYVLRNGDWAKFFIETWMDPLYQSYNFQKAERHALVSSILPTRSHVLTPFYRSTLCNGIPRSSPSSRSCRSGRLPRTDATRRETRTGTATLSRSWWTAPSRVPCPARSCRITTSSS